MKVDPNRHSLRSLPSRSNFAIFRLIGYLRTQMTSPETEVSGALGIDRGQNTFEQFTVALWVLLTTTCYCVAGFASSLSMPIAIALGVVAAPIVLQIPFYATGLILMPFWRRVRGQNDRNNIRPNSFMTMAAFLVASAWFATRHDWTSGIALVSLGLAAFNGAAAVVMWLLRNSVRAMETRCAG